MKNHGRYRVLIVAPVLALLVFSQGWGAPPKPDLPTDAANVTNDIGETARPNIVFFLVDDLGWADLGCYGSRFHETPHIDALAASAVRFTNAYAACPVCSPTRASIMTGRHPVRVDITDWIPGKQAKSFGNPRFLHVHDRDELALAEVTLAEVLRAAGYQNFFAGKWHLGGEGFLPTDQGFDFNVGGFHKGSPPGGYYSPWKNPYLKAQADIASGEREYLTERLTDESIQFIHQRDTDRPFLLFLSYYNVHTPITPYEKRVEHFRAKREELYGDSEATPIEEHGLASTSRQDNAAYASMVAAVDDSVGRILAALDEQGLDDNTIVVFFSDNGGLCTLRRSGPTSNLPLRSGKGWLYEGGIREPLIIRAPGHTTPGTTLDQPVVSMDFFPTLLELTGVSLRPEVHADGISLARLLQSDGTAGHPAESRVLYWHYPHYHGSFWAPGSAVRNGDWKLIEFYETEEVELYDLATDPGEANDLSRSEPATTERLRQQLREWQLTMKARMPQPNPDYQPTRPSGQYLQRKRMKR